MIQFNRRELVQEMCKLYDYGDIIYSFAEMTDKQILTYYQTSYKNDKRKKSKERNATL